MTSYPYWTTPPNLGNFADGTSFSSNPINLIFGETANLPCTVLLLNGNLPQNTYIKQNGFVVQLLGQPEVTETTSYSFTLRINNGSLVADQTFYITVTKIVDIVQFTTSNANPIGYYYSNSIQPVFVNATSNPPKNITYSLDQLGVCQGISINPGNGQILFDINWKPNFSYQANRDFVYSNNELWQCSVSGLSLSNTGPISGTVFYDGRYQPWMPNAFYDLNAIVTNDGGKLYICIVAGTSGLSGGPTGTGNHINDGVILVWEYIGQVAVWNLVASDTIIGLPLSVTARTATQSITQSFVVNLLATPFAPIFGDSSPTVLTITPNSEFQYQIPVTDPNYVALTFSTQALPSWLTLNPNNGQLSGYVPNYSSNTSIEIVVSATDGYYTSTITYILLATISSTQLQFTTSSNLGNLSDGMYANIQFQATSPRPQNPIYFNLSGGTLPPATIVLSQTGNLSGIIETHLVQKTYLFEITATDGVESVIKQFSLTITPQNLGKFANVSIPILGNQRTNWLQGASNLVNYTDLYLPQDPWYGYNRFPEIQIVDGIYLNNIEYLRNAISYWLHDFAVELGQVYITPSATEPWSTCWLSVHDSNKVSQWLPNTQYRKGDRVSNFEGYQYVCVIQGISGNLPGPKGTGTSINDNTTVWQFVATPNTFTPWTWDLPWYPEHFYDLGEAVVHDGLRLKSTGSGLSGGGLGPQLQPDGTYYDGNLIWTVTNTNTSSTAVYPSSIYNIRENLITTFGFSNPNIVPATASVIVNSVTSQISRIIVTNSGSGYFTAPNSTITGNGSGATAQSYLGLLSGIIVNSTSGFQVGQEFYLTQGLGDPGVIRIDSVDINGFIQSVSVVTPGKYTQFPDKQLLIVVNDSNQFTLSVTLGVIAAEIITPGTGYGPETTINLKNVEKLFGWQKTLSDSYITCIPLASVMPNTQLLTNANTYQGEILPVNAIKVVTQGAKWEGNTLFDGMDMFDETLTRFVEVDTDSQTTFDNNKETFDQNQTVFDAYGNLITDTTKSLTTFDNNTTIFDWMATIIDARSSQRYSLYSRQYLFYFGEPFSI